MRAMVYAAYGRPEGMRLTEVDRPAPGPDEVLIRIRAASINSWDWDLLRGKPFYARMGSPFRPQYPILGADVAGEVAAVGEGVTRFKPGDRVFGDLSGCHWGGFAEYATGRADMLALIPEGVGFEAAAATPQAGLLAWQGLHWKGMLRPGDRLLVNGGGGGAGTFAIQFARLAGAEVTGVDRVEKLELMRRMGANQVLDFATTDFTATDQRYDFILDMVANRRIAHYRRALAPTGRFVVVGGSIRTILGAALGGTRNRAGGQQLGLLLHHPDAGQLDEIGRQLAAGQVTPAIDRVYRLEELPAALRRIGEGRALGKLVVVP